MHSSRDPPVYRIFAYLTDLPGVLTEVRMYGTSFVLRLKRLFHANILIGRPEYAEHHFLFRTYTFLVVVGSIIESIPICQPYTHLYHRSVFLSCSPSSIISLSFNQQSPKPAELNSPRILATWTQTTLPATSHHPQTQYGAHSSPSST